jgi:hypothetical protein
MVLQIIGLLLLETRHARYGESDPITLGRLKSLNRSSEGHIHVLYPFSVSYIFVFKLIHFSICIKTICFRSPAASIPLKRALRESKTSFLKYSSDLNALEQNAPVSLAARGAGKAI